MAELITKETEQSVAAFLNTVEPEKKRADAFRLLELIKETTGQEPRLWGGNIVGFGKYSYTYNSGHSGESFVTGFSPRKQNLTLYLLTGFERPQELMEMLGLYKTGKACLYINKMSDIDEEVLKELIKQSVEQMAVMYPGNA